MRKKVLSRLTVLSLLAAQLAACGDADQVTDTMTDASSSDNTSVIETENDPYERFYGINYDGQTFTGLIRTQFSYEFDIETETGDVIDDAVYERELKIEDTLNANLEWHCIPGSFPERSSFTDVYKNSILSGDGAFDYVMSAANYMLPLMAEGCYVDLNKVDSISLDEPWYSQGFIENLSIDGRLYCVTGSASINYLENMCVLFFNKDLLEDLGYTAPYDDVRNGSWTFYKLEELVRDSYQDLNGNGQADDEDQYGFLTYNNMLNAQLVGMGLKYIENEGGISHIKPTLDERTVAIYDEVESFMNDLEATYHYNDTSADALKATEIMLKLWDTGNILFFPSVLSSAVKMRDTNFDFGILPFPKYNEEQESYHTFILENVTVIGIPPTADAEKSGTIIDFLSAVGYNELDSVYFDIAMKNKYSRDNDTKEMLDIIRNNIFFEYPLMTQFVGQCIYNKSPLISTYESQAVSAIATYDKLISDCMELEQ